VVEALFWPALLAYGEAALAYASARTSRAATWGVRIGWLAQTALLAAQAARSNGFPWSSWAGSLNLFVWFVVGAYLIWGCRPRFRLLGLTVMPLAVILFVVARVGGGTSTGARSHYGNLFLVLHVGLVLAAFAGFTLAAALAALYLWEERRHQAARGRHPPASPTAAGSTGAAHVAHDRRFAAAAHARPRGRGRAPAQGRRLGRRARGAHRADVASSTAASSWRARPETGPR